MNLSLAAAFVCALGAVGGEAPPKPEPAAPAASRSSPRATMMTFLEALGDAKRGQASRVRDAVECLDLSKIDSLARKDLGPRLAWTLLDVLDRTWSVDPDELPERPEGDVFRRDLLVGGHYYGSIAMVRQANAEWLFDAEMVAGLDRLARVVERLAYLEDRTGSSGQNPGLWLESRVPESLRRTAFLLAHWQWIALLVLIALGFAIDRLVAATVRFLLSRWMRKKNVEPEETGTARAERPVGLLAMGATWWIGLHWLNLPSQVHAALAVAAKFFAAAAGIWALYRLVDVFSASLWKLSQRTDRKMDDMLVQIVRKTLKVFVFVMGLIFMAENLGVEVKTMLAGLGIGGLAFALAAKDTVENLFGSLTVLVDRPFKIGDLVRIADVEGTVEELGFRSTRIRTGENSLVTVPNSKLVGAFIHNYSAREKRRIRSVLALKLATPPEKVEEFCASLRENIRKNPASGQEPCQVHLFEVSAASLKVLVNCFVRVPDEDAELRERERLYLEILRLAQRMGVELV